MRVLVATDGPWIVDEVVAALGDPDTEFTAVSEGREVAKVVEERADRPFDIGIFDSQIGSMGGMAVTMALRLDESSGISPRVPTLILLDRFADVHLARRSGADGWLIKPLDPLRLRRAVRAVTSGQPYREGFADVQAKRSPAAAPTPR